MMRISLDSPALIAVRNWLAGSQPTQRGRNGSRMASRPTFRTEQLEPRTMLDAGGMLAGLPDLVDESDTGSSAVDNRTSDRTPILSGSVQGAASQVRVRINGVRVAVVPVMDGKWTYAVPAEAALAAGLHKIAVRPIAAPGRVGPLSKELAVTVGTRPPAASTLVLGPLSDTGVRGDGQTTYPTPTFRGVARPRRLVNVSIDGVFAGQVQSDAKTGAWLFKSPRLANGTHDVTAVVENRVGLQSEATSLQVTVNGPRTVMLDATGGQAVELTAADLLGRNSQGFVVTQVHSGTLQKWSAAKNTWLTIPASAVKGTDPASLQKAAAIRKVSFNDVVRWTPSLGAVGTNFVFTISPLDTAGGPTAPTPAAGAVPGKIIDPKILFTAGVGTTLSWAAPTDGCGCASTRYSIEVTREDGKTLLYSVPASVTQLSVPEGGRVLQAELWGATKSGAGTKRSYDAVEEQLNKNRLAFNVVSGLSALSVGEKARAQLAYSPTAVDGSKPTVVLGGSHANLAYLEVRALPDATEAALGLPAGTPIMISSDSNKLTPAEKATLEENPILARNLFPGTVNGKVLPDQVRAHFQAGETLRFAGNVDKSVRAGARIVVEEAQILVNNSLGPWFEKARLAVGADGAYSYDHVVAYGMTSVRVRLEHPTTQSALGASASASSTPTAVSTAIDLSHYFNAFGITTAPWQVPNNQGFDGNGNYYNSDYTGTGTPDPVPGTPIIYQGITFPIGNIPTEDSQVGLSGNSATQNPPNFVQSKGQTIAIPPNLVAANASDFLYLAGAAANGNQPSQKITLNFADGSTEPPAPEIWTQSFHDWSSGGPTQPSKLADLVDSATVPGANQKSPVRVATTASLQNSNPSSTYETFSGLQTIDGVALAEGDRVLVKDQAHQQYNGIYVAFAGTWVRAKDALTPEQLVNASVSVQSGTINGGNYFWNNELSSELLPAIQSHLPELLATFKSYLSELRAADPKLSRKIEKIEIELARAYIETPTLVPELIRTTIIHQLYFDGYNVQQLKVMEAKINNLIAEIYPVNFVEATAPVPTPRTFAGELLLKTEPERINQQGNLVTTPAHLFAYCYNLHGKQLASITLPDNEHVGILSVVVAKAPVVAIDQGIASLILGTTNLTGVDVVALTIVNESNIGAGGSPLTFFFADQPEKGSTTSVALSSIATTGGISRDGQSFSGDGFDGDGNAYSWEALGSSKILRGTSVNFKLGLPGQKNFVVANGQTIQVPQGSSYTTLNLAGAAINGSQQNQPLTLTFTDNSTAVWTQSFSEWTNPANYTNESTIATAVYSDTASGGRNQTTNHIYQYSYTIPSGKQLASITLPTNSNVRLLDIQITPPTYTTKQVTVPMGQQTTIAYIAPDSTSGMAFYVQKADGCVGPNCSTYLTDWTSGSGGGNDTAQKISPSLNSQMKAGQQWKMTLQNAGEGYYGYLDSPSGKNLPGPSGNTPGGAQFRLMTATEIKAQPPWLLATEATIGTAIVLVGIGILTYGEGDVDIEAARLAKMAAEETDEIIPEGYFNNAELELNNGQWTEKVQFDLGNYLEMKGFGVSDLEYGQIIIQDDPNEDELLRRSFGSFRSDGGMNSFGSFR